MKRILLLSTAAVVSAAISAQTVANMNDLKPEQKAMAVSLKLTGELSTKGNSDCSTVSITTFCKKVLPF